MEYIISIAVSVVATVLGFMLKSAWGEIRTMRKEKEARDTERETALETGVRQLLSVRLEEMYDQYAEVDKIPRRVYSRWMKLHSAYKGLHGNGTFDHMKQEMDEKHLL